MLHILCSKGGGLGFSPLEQYHVLNFFGLYEEIVLPNFTIPLILVYSWLFFLYQIVKYDLFLVPISIVQQIFETFLLFIIRIVKQQVGNLGFIYTPLILSLFFSILFCNLLSLTPFSVALTSHISLVAFITFIVNFSIFYQGLINNDSKFLSLFVPSSPLFLLLLLIPIELFSYSIRALSMGIRLTANIIAGHTLVFIVSNFLIKIFLTKVFFFFTVFLLLFAIFLLEFGVSFLQAYVFTVLFCIYLNDSLSLSSH